MFIDTVIPMSMPVAQWNRTIVTGSATIYRTRLVKLKRRKRLPMNAQARERAFRAKHLLTVNLCFGEHAAAKSAYHCGSGFPVELACAKRPLSPCSSFLHEVTSAAIDITLAIGASVAAINGIAVELNHQSLQTSQYP